jgi:thiosulfate dehydrogenase
MRRAFVAVVLAVVCAPACRDPEVVVETRSAMEHGKDLFSDPSISGSTLNELSCANCHSENATDTDERLAGAPLAGVLERPSYWGGQESTLLGAVNHCLYYFMLKDAPWTSEDVEARAMYAYLESLEADAPSHDAVPFTLGVVDDLGDGDAARGGDLYGLACASCHGEKSSGAAREIERAPLLPDQWLADHPLSEYTEEERRLVFIEKTRHGGFLGYGGQMPPFSVERLSDQELADILAYVVEGQ